MEFEYFEYKFSAAQPGRAQRISSTLADQGYQSLRRDTLDLVRRYLPNVQDDHLEERGPAHARTTDVLVPASARTTRIVVADRPGPDGGTTVAVIAVGRSNDEARKACIAAKMALHIKDLPEDGSGSSAGDEPGRGAVPRFREEWARALGLKPLSGQEAGGSAPRTPASSQALLVLQTAPLMLGRPGLLRSRLGKAGNGSSAPADVAQFDALATEGLVDRSFVLVCRDSGHIVGVGKDSLEVQTAMQVSLRCPHCRRPLSEETHDVVYSLSPKGEEFLKGAGWIRAAVDASLRRRNCDPLLVAEVPEGRVHAALSYKEAVLLFRMREGAPADADVRSLAQAGREFGKLAPGITVHGVIVATQPAPAKMMDGDAFAPAVVVTSQLEDNLDRLLDDVKHEMFVRLSGTAIELLRTDPSSVLG